jgi:outer membrane lipoprotein-sorting protein
VPIVNCLAAEQLVELALADATAPDRGAERAHVAACARCGLRLREVEGQMSRLEHAMTWFDGDHAAERKRLLAALTSIHKEQPSRFSRGFPRKLKEVLTMPRTWIGSAVAAALILGALFLWHGPGALSALAQTAQALREVKSYQCQVTIELSAPDGKKTIEVGKLFWAAPGTWRRDSFQKDKLISVQLWRKDKPGLEIDHRFETYTRLEPMKGAVSPLLALSKLAAFAGQADRELEPRMIKDKRAPGFEIALAKIDPDLGDGTVRLWSDPKTKLPLRTEIAMDTSLLVMDDFEWNVPSDTWFTLEPPAGYQDKTPTPPGVEKITKDIVLGLKTFAKYGGGKYPQVKMVYGDTTSEELNVNAGLPRRGPPKDIRSDVYVECLKAYAGFGQINHLQRHDAGAVYHGKTVGPEDKNKVLFRWTLTDGRFRVIYGDLHVEDVTEARLKMLEAN